jgi:hypothetical protein
MVTKMGVFMKIVLLVVGFITALSSSAFADRKVTCESITSKGLTAEISLVDAYGTEVLDKVTIGAGDIQVLDVSNENDILQTSLFRNSDFLQALLDSAKLKAYDNVDLKYSVAPGSGSRTAAEIIERISDDGAGVVYLEASKNGKFVGAALLAGWGGQFVNCTEN